MTLNKAIMQLLEMRESSMMPTVFKVYINDIIKTVSQCEEPSAHPEPCEDMSDYSDKLWKNGYERGRAEALQEAIYAVKDALLAWSYLPEWRDDQIVQALVNLTTVRLDTEQSSTTEDAVRRKHIITHMRKRLYECAANNIGIETTSDAVFEDIAENRIETWVNEIMPVRSERNMGGEEG